MEFEKQLSDLFEKAEYARFNGKEVVVDPSLLIKLIDEYHRLVIAVDVLEDVDDIEDDWLEEDDEYEDFDDEDDDE